MNPSSNMASPSQLPTTMEDNAAVIGRTVGACKNRNVVKSRKQCYLTSKLPNGSLQYKCTVCGKMFSSEGDMVSHKKKHVLQESASVCSDKSTKGKVPNSNGTQSQPDSGRPGAMLVNEDSSIALHPPKLRLYICRDCKGAFPDKELLTKHQRVYHKALVTPSGINDISLNDMSLGQKDKCDLHKWTRDVGVCEKCPSCEVTFDDEPLFTSHWQSSHNLDNLQNNLSTVNVQHKNKITHDSDSKACPIATTEGIFETLNCILRNDSVQQTFDVTVNNEDISDKTDISMNSTDSERKISSITTPSMACNSGAESGNVEAPGLSSVKCKVCHETFSKKEDLNKHILRFHFSQQLSKSLLSKKGFAQKVNCKKIEMVNENCEEGSANVLIQHGNCLTGAQIEIRQGENNTRDQGKAEESHIEEFQSESGVEGVRLKDSAEELSESRPCPNAKDQVEGCIMVQRERKMYPSIEYQHENDGSVNCEPEKICGGQPQEVSCQEAIGEFIHRVAQPDQQENCFTGSSKTHLVEHIQLQNYCSVQDVAEKCQSEEESSLLQGHSECCETDQRPSEVWSSVKVDSEPGVDLPSESEKCLRILSEFLNVPYVRGNQIQCRHHAKQCAASQGQEQNSVEDQSVAECEQESISALQTKRCTNVQSESDHRREKFHTHQGDIHILTAVHLKSQNIHAIQSDTDSGFGDQSENDSTIHCAERNRSTAQHQKGLGILGELVYITPEEEKSENQPTMLRENNSFLSEQYHANNCNRANCQLGTCPELCVKAEGQSEIEQKNGSTSVQFQPQLHQGDSSKTVRKSEKVLRESTDLPLNDANDDVKGNSKEVLEKKEFICQLCDGPFKEQVDLLKHDCLILKEYRQCPICHKKFSNKANCSRHYKMMHIGYRPFKCDKCDRAFFQRRTLEGHQRNTNKLSLQETEAETGSNTKMIDVGCKSAQKRKQSDDTTSTKQDSQCAKVLKQNSDELKDITHEEQRNEKLSENRLPHRCPICSQSFQLRFHFIRHYESFHVKHQHFECSQCPKFFQDKQALVGHEQTIHEQSLASSTSENAPKVQTKLADDQEGKNGVNERTLFKCEMCSESFTKNAAFIRHQCDIHNILRPHKCPVCLKLFTRKGNCDRHYRLIHLQAMPFKCLKCGKEYSTKQLMGQHRCDSIIPEAQSIPKAKGLRYVRGMNSNLLQTATKTSKPFSKSAKSVYKSGFKSALLRHKHVSHKGLAPHVCPVCCKQFSLKASLVRHKRCVHAGIKPYRCPICSRTFSLKASLVRHQRCVHAGIKPYRCPICSTTFSLKTSLVRHQRCVHAGIKPYRCPICSTTFSLKASLVRHQRCVHAGVKPKLKSYTCPVCNKSFSTNDHCIRHQKTVHLNEKNHGCETCCKAFSTRGQLLKHERSVHAKLKPYTCPVCNKTFSTMQNCARHQTTVHLLLKDFRYNTCTKSNSVYKDLLQRKRSNHAKLKPFVCPVPVCQKAFRSKVNCTRHHQVVHLRHLFHKCKRCVKTFFDKRSLETHQRNYHKGDLLGKKPTMTNTDSDDTVTVKSFGSGLDPLTNDNQYTGQDKAKPSAIRNLLITEKHTDMIAEDYNDLRPCSLDEEDGSVSEEMVLQTKGDADGVKVTDISHSIQDRIGILDAAAAAADDDDDDTDNVILLDCQEAGTSSLGASNMDSQGTETLLCDSTQMSMSSTNSFAYECNWCKKKIESSMSFIMHIKAHMTDRAQ